MDKAVIRYYRHLLKTGFPYSGALEHASIVVEDVGQKVLDCGSIGNYMQLYVRVVDTRIEEIAYLCSCAPTANVAVEMLCALVEGMPLEEAAGVSEQVFDRLLGSEDEELRIKARGLLALLNEGVARYRTRQRGDCANSDG